MVRRGKVLVARSARWDPGLSIIFREEDLLVPFHRNGDLVDFIFWPEVLPEKIGPHAYACRFCSFEKKAVVFANRVSLYRDHILAPLLRLAQADALSQRVEWMKSDGFGMASLRWPDGTAVKWD